MDNQLFDCRRDGDRCDWRPSGLWARLGFGLFLFGAAFLVFLGGTFFWRTEQEIVGIGFGVFLLFGAALLTWQASHYWRLRYTSLAVDGTGRVSYGEMELSRRAAMTSAT